MATLWRRVFWSQVEYKIVCFILVIGKSPAGSHYQLRWPFQSLDVIGLGYGRPFHIEFISLGSGK